MASACGRVSASICNLSGSVGLIIEQMLGCGFESRLPLTCLSSHGTKRKTRFGDESEQFDSISGTAADDDVRGTGNLRLSWKRRSYSTCTFLHPICEEILNGSTE